MGVIGSGCGDGREVDGVTELGELRDEPVAATLGVVVFGEVVAAKVTVGLAGGDHDVVGGDQQLVRDPHGGLALR